MDFHNITMDGYFKSDTVVDASALVHQASDEYRLVYDETTKDLWVADNTDWKYAGQYADTPLGTEMWIYANSAPTGWAISSGSDDLIAVKGGSYVTGGTVDGNWATPSHSHTLNSHTHTFSGSTTGYSGSIYGGRSPGEGSELVIYTHQHSISGTLVGAAPGSTATNGSVSTYRPESRVGLICERV
jgi:hypothetical protein